MVFEKLVNGAFHLSVGIVGLLTVKKCNYDVKISMVKSNAYGHFHNYIVNCSTRVLLVTCIKSFL